MRMLLLMLVLLLLLLLRRRRLFCRWGLLVTFTSRWSISVNTGHDEAVKLTVLPSTFLTLRLSSEGSWSVP